MTLVAHPLVEKVIGCAIAVHRALGPGLLESAYRQCLCAELEAQKIPFETEVPVAIRYRNILIDRAYRMDLLVDGWLVVEIKAVEQLVSLHSAQLLTYVNLSDARQGLIFNFNAVRLKDGLKSVIRAERQVDPS